MEPTGIVGLGLVGTSLARRLLAAGHAVHGFDIAPHAKVFQSRKDFLLMLETGTRSGQQLPLARVYLELIQGCIDHGESDLDNSAVIREIRRRRGQRSKA